MTEKHAASLIIIGDEILRGQIQDAHTVYLAKSLQSIGIKIRKVTIIPDEIDTIAKEVSESSKNFPLVFTSGGVGPTHDDRTYEGVAQGLGLSLKEDQGLLECLNRLFPDKPESRRLATVPYPCELIQVSASDSSEVYAVVKAKNVYVLPGSPGYFRPAVDKILSGLEASQPLHRDTFELRLDEFSFVSVLDEKAKRWQGSVEIGSYPQTGTKTLITLEGVSLEAVAKAKKDILDSLPESTMSFNVEAAKKVYDSAKDLEHVAGAFEILEKCYDKYKANEVFLSFNGGKDCTVVLHLAATLAQLRKLDTPLCLYVTGDAFFEVEEFVKEAAKYYGVELVYKNGSIREALSTLLEEKPSLQACLLGTRKGDPGAHSLDPFTPTDPGWPKIMRVSPIINWSYNQVWKFLLRHNVPYCSLYDEGYTSLGSRDSTTKNPLLQDPNNPSRYLPAHTLADDSTERHGRL